MKKIVGLRVLENYRVWLRFSDGVEGEVDFSEKPRTGVFAFWIEYNHFRQARIGDGGELIWNDQIDFCPDTLWQRIATAKNETVSALRPQGTHA